MRSRQQGSVIIVTLWTITLMTILVAVIASQNRLSAQAAYFHKQDLDTWAKVVAALNQAEMDVVLGQQPQPVVRDATSSNTGSLADRLNALSSTAHYRYNGDELQLHYPQADDIAVRIYSHAGKINIRQISRPRLRSLIEKKLGGPLVADQRQIDNMMEAWNDWLDLNDGASVIGAETDYYMGLDPPYRPRNGSLETVEEILLIRGFAEVFGDVDLDAAFTLYGDDERINLNIATIEAMRLLPGLDDELIEKIVAFRQEKEFRGNGDVAQLIPAEKMAELRQWLNSQGTSTYYTIMVYRKPSQDEAEDAPEDDEEALADAADADTMPTAYAEIVFAPTWTDRPRILKVNPYQRLPEHLHIVDPDSAQEDR